jgi:hypothetical protein
MKNGFCDDEGSGGVVKRRVEREREDLSCPVHEITTKVLYWLNYRSIGRHTVAASRLYLYLYLYRCTTSYSDL